MKESYIYSAAVNGLKPTAFASIEGNQDSALFGSALLTAAMLTVTATVM